MLAVLALAANAAAQCVPQWAPGDGLPGANSSVEVFASWDPDGVGGSPPLLVAGGTYTTIASAQANRIATRDPATGVWSPLGAGISGSGSGFLAVRSLATAANGDLIVAGSFQAAGGAPASNIARWNGSSWAPLGSGLNGIVHAVVVLPGGDLVAGGEFLVAGGTLVRNIARWDGSTWSSLGGGLTTSSFPSVRALAVLANGDLIAAGRFSSAGGTPVSNIARWNGAAWTSVGSGTVSTILSLTTMPNGDVVAGGTFTSIDGVAANRIARWNGATWQPLGGGLDDGVWGLAVAPNGDLLAGGRFDQAGGAPAAGIARWDGGAWSPLGSGVELTNSFFVAAMAPLPNGVVMVGGFFESAGGVVARSIAEWDGSAWSAVATGLDARINDLEALPNGDVLAAGDFVVAGGAEVHGIARWNGSSWSALGGGMDDTVEVVTTLPNGDVLAGGWFSTAGGVAASRIARWDGSSWSPLGVLGGTVYSLAVAPNGDILAGGVITMVVPGVAAVVRWDGSAWLPLGGIGSGSARALEFLPDGDLVAGGSFTGFPGGLVRWDGSSWSSLGGGVGGSVGAMIVLANGDLVVGGDFPTAGFVTANDIARWDGSSWNALGSGLTFGSAGGGFSFVGSLASLPNGDLVAGGQFGFAGGNPANHIARWNGASWSALGDGFGGALGPQVLALATLPGGELLAGGEFTTVDGMASAHFARYTTPCPASAVVASTGCPSSAGANELTAVTLPWVGSTLQTAGSGMPPLALIGVVTGLSPISLPLATLLPQGQSGCSLDVPPDLVTFTQSQAGAAEALLALPNDPTLSGTVLYQQMVPFELDAALSITAVTATNSLAMTIGSF